MPACHVYICGHSADAGAGGRGTGGRHRRLRRRRAQAQRKWRCNGPIAQGYARMRMRPALFVLWPARGFVPCGSKALQCDQFRCASSAWLGAGSRKRQCLVPFKKC